MNNYPYVLVPNRLKQYLQKIPSLGVPDKLTTKVLESHGFKSDNDRAIISVLKFLDFVDPSGVPTTEGWHAYRDKRQGSRVLGGAIRKAYRELFATYSDAYRQSDEAIENFIRSDTKVSEVTLARIVTTFKALCDLASFDAAFEQDRDEVNGANGGHSSPNGSASTQASPPDFSTFAGRGRDGELTLNVNIELHLPATQDGEIYDKLFSALRKHLLEK